MVEREVRGCVSEGECCRPRRVQVVELAPRVRSTHRFVGHAVVEQGIEPRIRIGL